MATVLCGMTVERNPPQSRLDELGVASWAKMVIEKPKLIIRHTFKFSEYTYIFKGKAKITVDGYGEEPAVEIGAGDLIVVPTGLTIEFELIEAVDKAFLIVKDDEEAPAAST